MSFLGAGEKTREGALHLRGPFSRRGNVEGSATAFGKGPRDWGGTRGCLQGEAAGYDIEVKRWGGADGGTGRKEKGFKWFKEGEETGKPGINAAPALK